MGFLKLRGGITADEDALDMLRALKLDTLEAVFEYEGEGYLRHHANRENYHIVADLQEGRADFFLKRHRGFEIKEAVKFLMAHSPAKSAARREWDNIFRLEGHGISTMRPIAFGEKKLLGIERKSFLITETIPSAVPLDSFLREHYSENTTGEKLRQKRALLWDAGALVRRLHSAGLTHMDLYLNHIFVRETPDGDKVLHLIDLQRLEKRWIFKRRWVVKDLAALLYSMRDLPLSRTDVARLLDAYFDGAFAPESRRLLRDAMQRCRRMIDASGRSS